MIFEAGDTVRILTADRVLNACGLHEGDLAIVRKITNNKDIYISRFDGKGLIPVYRRSIRLLSPLEQLAVVELEIDSVMPGDRPLGGEINL